MISCPLCYKKNSSSFYKIDRFHYFFCQICQSLFLYPLPKEEELISFYKKKYRQEVACQNQKRLYQRAEIILKKLKKLNPSGTTLLDIGSGYGFFLDQAKKFGLKTLGVEPSNYLAECAKKKFALNIVNLDFETYFAKNPNQKFDFITLIHVIEHLINPKKILEKISRLLKPNGILYIETPNLDSHLFWREKKDYIFLTPPDHVYIFSRRFFEQNNFKKKLKLISLSTYSYSEHFMGVIKRVIFNRPMINNEKKFCPTKSNQSSPNQLTKKIKFYFFDSFLAKLFYPILNIGNKGSILEVYYQKVPF
ncbi:MAG: class I SAM-dependent methyltransferase [Microgenomates group bacterium]|nr:class I SAM-dependent methyltransferase [Microgenomates group bacterium]